MDVTSVKIELIELLLKENKESTLLAIKDFLLKKSKTEIETINLLLEESEKQYQNGLGVDYELILNESKAKYSS